MSNVGTTLTEKNHLARAERCRNLAVELAELLNRPDHLFDARFYLFQHYTLTGRLADAELVWQVLDSMGRDWARNYYRPGDAEVWRARLHFEHGNVTDRELQDAQQLAQAGRSRQAIRDLHRLRGDWRLQQHDWAGAADSLAEAVRLARESHITDTEAETRHALARFQLGQLPDPPREANRLSQVQRPACLPLAQLWEAMGDVAQATKHALSAYRHAWADGPPHTRRHPLAQATTLLSRLNTPVPDLPAYDPARHPQSPWEDQIVAGIHQLRAKVE